MGFLRKFIEAFKDWLSRMLPDCKNITPTIGESMDRELGRWERFVMKLHLFTCDRCGRYLEQLKFLSTTFRSHSESIADPEPGPGASAEYNTASKTRLKGLLAAAVALN